ncbi:ComEC/Rec2-related protein [Natronospira proteinivora]|uniref:ComEC/Rec2-related protein n=1 Tax=Natronospira proteinivora TaxID=1807133 RepID=A0ABT1G6I2_9GAMM|nr:ComEC/Rec2 family competence protein [Natronospira proteinivora]MCP1726702.1 ComEC/Rec2-related protein [Natronospira proteinivora]
MQGFAIGLFLGCFLLVWAPAGVQLPWLMLSAGLLLAAVLCLRPALWVVSGFLLGLLLSGVTVHQQLNHGPHWQPGQTLTIEGRISGLVVEESGRLRFEFQPLDETGQSWGGPLRLSWSQPALAPRSGEVWRLPLRLDGSEGEPLPGAFDRDRWLFRQGLAGSARVDVQGTAIRLRTSPAGVSELRRSLSQAVKQFLESRPEAALIRGVTVGDRSGFSEEHWRVLNATGTTHLVAISGLHIGLVGGMVLGLGHLLARYRPGRTPATVAAAGLALVTAAAYATLAGFALPTQRALLMFSVLVLLILTRRQTGPAAGLSLAAVGVLLLDPLAVMDAGFYLSFALVAMVLMVVAAGDRPRPWLVFVRVQWVTGLAVLPLLMLLFASGPITGPVANALAVPVFSLVVVPISLLGALFWVMDLTVPAQMAWMMGAEVLEWLWRILRVLAEGPVLTATMEPRPVWVFTGLLAMAAILLPGPVWTRGLLLCALLPVVLGPRPEPPGQWQLQHWGLPGGGHAWSIHGSGDRLIWLDVGRPDLRASLNHWLAAELRDESAGLLLNPRGSMGPASLDPVLALMPGHVKPQSGWPALMPEPGRASPGPARHCDGIQLDGWRFERKMDAAGESFCQVTGQGMIGSLVLGRDDLRILDRNGDSVWAASAEAWSGTARVEISGDRIRIESPRPYWWRP